MWIARDEDGSLYIHEFKPNRCVSNDFKRYWATLTGLFMKIDNNLFLSLKWEDEPVEVKLIAI